MSKEYRLLYILVEGVDDERFFSQIVAPLFEKNYDAVKIVSYAQKTKRKVKDLLRGIGKQGARFFIVADIDRHRCVTQKKRSIARQFGNIDDRHMVVVIKESESWYLAGLDVENARKLNLRIPASTDHISKDEFDRLIPASFDSRIDFMIELLKCYSLRIARRKNASFKYFHAKHISQSESS